MLAWMIKHSVGTWAIAWCICGIGFQLAEVFSEPRGGPLWIAVIPGLLAWGVAGAVTFHGNRLQQGMVIWAFAYLCAFGLAASLGSWFEHNQVGPYSSAGFVGALIGWAGGAALGALVSGYTAAPGRRGRAFAVAVAWGFAFFAAGYIALVSALLLGQAAKAALWFVRQQVALMVGWAIGWGLAGALAAVIGLTARRWLVDSLAKATPP